MVISHVRLTRQNVEAYALPFSKTFAYCKDSHEEFEVGKSLLGIVIDWCDAEINGLGKAVGRETAVKLLKGCSIHWSWSWQRVKDRICSSNNRARDLRNCLLQLHQTFKSSQLEAEFTMLLRSYANRDLLLA